MSIDHSFKAIPEHWQIFEWIVYFGHSFKRNEETTNQQERNDKHRHQSHYHSSIRENSRKEQSKRRAHVCTKFKSKQRLEEDTGAIVKVTREVPYDQEKEEREYFDRKHSHSSSRIVSRSAVGVTQPLSDEDRSFEVEDVDTGKDIGETRVHDEEEEDALVVLDNLLECGSFLIKKNDANDSEENGLDHLQNEIHGLSESVDSCSLEDRPELGAPASFNFFVYLDLFGNQRSFVWFFDFVAVSGITYH